MSVQINKGENGVTVIGDTELLKKLPEDFDASTIDISGIRIDAQTVAQAYNDAECKGVDAIKRYLAITQAFLHQQDLVQIERDKPRESHAPAITSQSIKPVSE